MRVVTHNLHAGVDGYGRTTTVVADTVALAPDLLFCQEVWRGEREDQYQELCDQLALSGQYVRLGVGDRVTDAEGGSGWQSPLALVRGESGLYFDERRPLTRSQRARQSAATSRESGEWGLALLTNRPILDIHVEYLEPLARDKVRRATILATLSEEGRPVHAVGVHGAHLTHGSLRQFRHVAARLRTLSLDPVLLGGDFNCWRPLLRSVLPGWRTGVRARTWPSWRPHSQIDHILWRGSLSVSGGHAVRTASDHRALVCDVFVGGAGPPARPHGSG